MNVITTDSLIIETPRGPSIAGTRITIYAVMDYLNGGWSESFIRQMLGISQEQLDAVTEYIAQHKDEVDHDYAVIISRADELRRRYESQNQGRSPFPPGTSPDEQRRMMLEKLTALKNGEGNGQPNPPGQ